MSVLMNTMVMNATHTTVRDDHYVVTVPKGEGERISFGRFLPLTKRAASQHAKQHGGRVIKRTTARKAGLFS